MLKGTAELQYSERLAILGAETLELRRFKADLMYIYKIVFGLLDVEPGTLDIKLKGGTATRLGTHWHAICVEEIHAESMHAIIVFKSQSNWSMELSPRQCCQF